MSLFEFYSAVVYILTFPLIFIVPGWVWHKDRTAKPNMGFWFTVLVTITTILCYSMLPVILPVVLGFGILIVPIYLVSKFFDKCSFGGIKATLRKMLD